MPIHTRIWCLVSVNFRPCYFVTKKAKLFKTAPVGFPNKPIQVEMIFYFYCSHGSYSCAPGFCSGTDVSVWSAGLVYVAAAD